MKFKKCVEVPLISIVILCIFSWNANAQNTFGVSSNIIESSALNGSYSNALPTDKRLSDSAGAFSTHMLSESAETNSRHRKSVFAEALGSGVGISGNFEMRFKKGRNDGFGFRAGLGLGAFYSSSGEERFGADRRYVTFPVMANYIKGINRSGFETAIGFTSQVAFSKVADYEQSYIPLGSLNVGYRLQPLKDGLLIRATWTPFFDNKGFYPSWAGFSIGYSFK